MNGTKAAGEARSLSNVERSTRAAEPHSADSRSLSNLERSLRETLRSSAADPEKRQKALEIQRQAWDQTRQVRSVPLDLAAVGDQPRDQQLKETVEKLRSKEDEINRRKRDVQLRVRAQVSRVESEARRLDELRRELEALEDPTRKEVSDLRKRIELVDRELRPMKALCDRKEKELKDAVAVYNDKSAQKTELVGRLFEIVTESERMRIAKLEELNRHLEAMEEKANGSGSCSMAEGPTTLTHKPWMCA